VTMSLGTPTIMGEVCVCVCVFVCVHACVYVIVDWYSEASRVYVCMCVLRLAK